MMHHPQLRTITYDTPEGEVTVIAPPAIVAGEDTTYRRVPAVGQHTAAVRSEFRSEAAAGVTPVDKRASSGQRS